LKALIIAAHGSRKNESNQEVLNLANAIYESIKLEFQFVEPAFLQFCEPLLEPQIDLMAEKGATHITIFPFFIGSGSHLMVDIPESIKKAKKKYPGVDFRLTRHLGKIEEIKEVIIREVQKK